MRLVTFITDERERIGILRDEMIYPIIGFESLHSLIRSGIQLDNVNMLDPIPAKRAMLLAPIPRPAQDIVCLGQNYVEHAQESFRFRSETFVQSQFPIYFAKRVNRAVAPDGMIIGHTDIVNDLDYEVELAVVIGIDAYNVSKEDAFQYVFGYTIINDVSARGLQSRHKQWYFGKSLDGFTPMGPCIVTRDEFPDPPDLMIRSYVNGELRQNARTSLLTYDIPYIIHDLSQGMTLKAGTIIATGTPAGVGMGMTPPTFLKPGDLVECEIEGIGRLANRVGA